MAPGSHPVGFPFSGARPLAESCGLCPRTHGWHFSRWETTQHNDPLPIPKNENDPALPDPPATHTGPAGPAARSGDTAGDKPPLQGCGSAVCEERAHPQPAAGGRLLSGDTAAASEGDSPAASRGCKPGSPPNAAAPEPRGRRSLSRWPCPAATPALPDEPRGRARSRPLPEGLRAFPPARSPAGGTRPGAGRVAGTAGFARSPPAPTSLWPPPTTWPRSSASSFWTRLCPYSRRGERPGERSSHDPAVAHAAAGPGAGARRRRRPSLPRSLSAPPCRRTPRPAAPGECGAPPPPLPPH